MDNSETSGWTVLSVRRQHNGLGVVCRRQSDGRERMMVVPAPGVGDIVAMFDAADSSRSFGNLHGEPFDCVVSAFNNAAELTPVEVVGTIKALQAYNLRDSELYDQVQQAIALLIPYIGPLGGAFHVVRYADPAGVTFEYHRRPTLTGVLRLLLQWWPWSTVR